MRSDDALTGEGGYERTRAVLAEREFVEDRVSPPTGEAFGSWVITVRHAPRLRVIWDGKDEWAMIQAELGKVRGPRGDASWFDLWIGKRTEDLTASAVASALAALRHFAAESRLHGTP